MSNQPLSKNWNLLTLVFHDAEKENAFRRFDYETTLGPSKLAMLLSPFVYFGYSFFDFILFEASARDMVVVRFITVVVLTPFIMTIWFKPRFVVNQAYISLMMMAYGLTMSVGVYLYDEQYALYFVTGLVMTNTYSALLFSIRLKQAATIIFTLSLICLLTVFTKYDNHVTRVTSFHVLFTMGLFLSWAIHRLELSKRLQFLKQLEVLEGQSRLARSEKKRANWLENTTNFLRHELRNSIRGISSSIEMFKRFHPEYEDDKYLKRSNHSINLSNRLLSNVGDAAALESQLVNEEKCILDLGELVEDYANIIDFSSDKCRVEVKRSTKASPVYANNERLIQALDNLLGNAFDHANPGSAIRLKISVDKHLVCLSVENEGRPLPDDKDIIFQAFVSKRGNETYNQNNMGIGLYMVKTIIEAYDGEVIAESLAQGEGAKFTIQLPLA